MFFLNEYIASVFSKKSIAGTSNKLRDAMEVVASRVDELGKSKIVPLPPQPSQPAPTTKPKNWRKKGETAYAEWDMKQYKGTEEQRRKERENRRLIREAKQKETEAELARKVKALQPLGDEDDQEEEMEAPPELDPPVPPTVPTKSTETEETAAPRNKQYELERRRKDKVAREVERARAATQPDDQDLPKAKSPGRAKAKSPGRAKAKSPGRAKGKSLGRAKPSTEPPKTKSPGRAMKDKEQPKVKSPDRAKPSTTKPKGKSPGRSSTGAKTPKAKEKPGDNAATDREVAGKTQNNKTKGTETSDDATSRPVVTRSTTQHVDDENYELDIATGKFIKKKKKKPVVREDDDDIEMEEIDDEDKDQDYDPNKDPDQGDDDDEPVGEEEEADDDFPIPPLRKKKTSDKSTSKQKKQKPSEEALVDLADFVEETFKKPTWQSTRKGKTQRKDDACINPAEAARFRKAMRDEVLELEKAVRKGTNVAKAYETLIVHVIQACKDMNYEIPADIEVNDILPTIEDPECKAWPLKLQGVQTAGEGELNVSKTDNAGVCVAKKKYEIKDIMAYIEEITTDWSELKRKNFLLAMKKVMANMTVAHRMVAEASQEIITLLDEIELPLWMKLADMTMLPLVHLELPEVMVMCEEARQISKENQQHWNQATKITTIMEAKNLPFLPTAWGYKTDGRAKKVITGIIYKYVKDQMYDGKIETPATEVSEKYALNSTTMNRHILGKKYEGGKASGSGTRRPAAVKVTATERLVDKLKKKAAVQANEGEQSARKSKGKGKSSGVSRTAQEIRDESTSNQQKQKAKKRKADEARLEEEEEEEEDRPTQAEIAQSGPPKKHITIC